MKLTTKLKRWIVKDWTLFTTVVDWAKANLLYIAAILFIMDLFGIIAPETATSLRDTLTAFLL